MKMRLDNRLILIFAGCALLLSPRAADAKKEKDVSKFSKNINVIDKADDKKVKKQGWSGDLRIGGSISFASSNNVIGQVDGTTAVFGVQLNAQLNYRSGAHDWRTRLGIQEALTRTPAVDAWVKSMDVLDFETLYFYRIKESWIGPFVRFRMRTALFEGEDQRSQETLYRIARLSGATWERRGTSLQLSDPFGPMSLEEAVGAFLSPLDSKKISIEGWVAFAGRQVVLADNQYALADDDATEDAIEVKELEDFAQAGPSIGISLKGSLFEDMVGYFARGEVMIPVIKTSLPAGDDRNALDLTNVSVEAGLALKVTSWASVNYSLRVLRDPQLLDAWQVQNALLLTFSYALIEAR
jgi:hypothetical protein